MPETSKTAPTPSARRVAGPSHGSPADRTRPALAVVGVVALLALGLAIWALLRPTPQSSSVTAAAPTYTDAQQAAAKSKVCAAHGLVRVGVNVNTNLQPPGGPDDAVGALAAAANARVALGGGGQYLLANLDPATPQPVADAVRPFALKLMDIGAAATAGIPNTDPQQAARLQDADKMNTEIANLCK
ncbi:hypothetical protein [Mycolicibacterium hodleri]|uniref:hypothetical protein n=1 Tax=Mycolicibacterium hodleri TaxID=49897 RepID=UPI0021F39861|nr:hypothetical protein [Mycolicibacterium hodleri]